MTRLLLLIAAVTLGLGLTGPCIRIDPHFGDYDGWVRLFADPAYIAPRAYSILSGIQTLFDQRQAPIAITLLLFSIVFPATKLALMAYAEARIRGGRAAGRALWLAHHGGKFSMLDVFVIGVLVVVLKGMPGTTAVQLGWGLYAFGVSVVLALVGSLMLQRVEGKKALDTLDAGVRN